MVDVIDEVAPDLGEFISSKTSNAVQIGGGRLCENVTLSLDYKLYWDENGITSVTLTRTVGTISIFNNGWSLQHLPIICIIVIIILTVLTLLCFLDSGVNYKVLCCVSKWASHE